jgi:hypothetical protein
MGAEALVATVVNVSVVVNTRIPDTDRDHKAVIASDLVRPSHFRPALNTITGRRTATCGQRDVYGYDQRELASEDIMEDPWANGWA